MNNQHDSVGAGEVAKFSQIADKWWGKNGEFEPLHDINPLRLDYIDGYTGLAGKRVLDVGCGGGVLSKSMAKRGTKRMTGIDITEKSPQTTAVHAASQRVTNIDYRCIHVGDLAAEQPHSFDVVTYMEIMKHILDPAAIVQAYTKLVKPDGMVSFSTTNRSPKFYLHLVVGTEYLLKFVPKGTHDWRKFIMPAELTHVCRQAGLDTVGSRGTTYNLLDGRYSLCDLTEVNYMVAYRSA